MNEDRIRPTRSGLFMIELLIAAGVFAFCAAVCVGLFVRAEVMSRDSETLTRASAEARSVVECWKAAGGDFLRASELCGAEGAENTLTVCYDRSWNRLAPGAQPYDEVYRLRLEGRREAGYAQADLWVLRDGETAPLLSWNGLAALEARS